MADDDNMDLEHELRDLNDEDSLRVNVDLAVLQKTYDDLRNRDLTQPHYTWPSLVYAGWSLGPQLEEAIIKIVEETGELDIHELCRWLVSQFQAHMITCYLVGKSEYELMTVDCEADHGV